MIKRVLVAVLTLGTLATATAAHAQEVDPYKVRQILQVQSSFMWYEFPLAEAEACDALAAQRRSRGATGSWDPNDPDYPQEEVLRCSEGFRNLMEIIALWTEGEAIPADCAIAWCVAVDVWYGAQEKIQETRDWVRRMIGKVGNERLYTRAELMQMKSWEQMTWQDQMFFMIVATKAMVTTSYTIRMPPH